MRLSRLRVGLIVLAALAVLAIVFVAVWRPGEYAPENPLSATAKTPLGMNALYQLLRNNGVKADYYGHSLGILPREVTLVVGDDFAGPRTYEWVEAEELWELVENNGNTVIYLPPMETKGFQARNPFEEETATEEGETPPLPAAPAPEETPAEMGPEVKCYEIPWEIDEAGYIHLHTAGLPGKYFGGVTELQAGGFQPQQDVVALSEDEKALATAQEVYFFENTDRPFLFVGRSGRGTWVAANVSELFTNRDIGRVDNAVFAFNLLSHHEGDGLAFYEAIHGYVQPSVSPTALIFQTHLGQLILLALVGIVIILLPKMFPLGRDIERPVIEFPSTLERVRAQAEIWRQGGHLKSAQELAISSVLGIDLSEELDELESLLRQVGYPKSRAAHLARELAGPDKSRRMSPAAVKAYDRIMRRFGLIRRFA